LSGLKRITHGVTKKITQLRNEIVADNAKIKELDKLCETLKQAELQERVSKLWFRDKKLSDEQIKKFLQLSEQIGDKIDSVDIETIYNLIIGTAGVNKKQAVTKPVPSADVPVVSDEPQEMTDDN
jgi:hypothetical protein